VIALQNIFSRLFRYLHNMNFDNLIKTSLSLFIIFMFCIMPLRSNAAAETEEEPSKKSTGEFSWEMPGRVSIYDLQFGPALFKDNQWQFLGSSRTFNAGAYPDKLTILIKFSYTSSRSETALKFMIKLPDCRQYEETVQLTGRKGNYTYQFTMHRPEDFVGSGSVYLYYGFSIVDVLDFTIMPGNATN
jgi:hypothetical protein